MAEATVRESVLSALQDGTDPPWCLAAFRTGLPARWREFEQEQLLRARMRQLRDQEGGGF